ncbi:MAG: DUF6516 family protein [bacterium]
MIEAYFEYVEKTIQDFPNIRSYTLSKKVYNAKQGFIRGIILFDDDTRLEFVEVKDVDVREKIKYRYQYMGKDHTMFFRYDNASHHPHILTFPHHKHVDKEHVKESHEPALDDVLLEVAQRRHLKKQE